MPVNLAERISDRNENQPEPEVRLSIEKKFVWMLSLFVGFLAAIPAFIAWQGTPTLSSYVGYVFSTDDQMVYAAWIRQAMDGQILFDNRFTTEAQPGLTINLYFLAVGQIARLTGIVLATHLVRIILAVVLVHQIFGLARRLDWPIFETKFAVVFAVFAGGCGFLVWHTFGLAIVQPTPEVLVRLLNGRLPIDVWQPEAFTFASMLTNGLFLAALSLILVVFQSFLDARQSWQPVLPGALAMLVLMNIHSYDVLMIALVMFGFLVMEWARDRVSGAWVARAFAIGAGALPSAAWFVYVLQKDTVFQARAATLTYAPNFASVLAGIVFPVILSIPILLTSRENKKRSMYATGLLLFLYLGLYIYSTSTYDGYFLSWLLFGGCYLFVVFLLYSLASLNSARNLLVAWAVLGPIIIYFPALFQRKLAMGMVIPWGILAAGGAGIILAKQTRSGRNLATILVLALVGASSLRWVTREVNLAQANVSNTTVNSVYLNADITRALSILDKEPGRKVILAMPGIATTVLENGQAVPDIFATPTIPDLNGVASGFTGAYSVAGHWSETPNYDQARSRITRLFLAATPDEFRRQEIDELGVTHILAPKPESFPELNLADMNKFGEEISEGTSFSLIRVAK